VLGGGHLVTGSALCLIIIDILYQPSGLILLCLSIFILYIVSDLLNQLNLSACGF